MKIGIDVGGTNTDAVLINGKIIIETCKTPTTSDVSSGILTALKHVLKACDPDQVQGVMLGTTHFANALVERRRLSRVAVLRLGVPFGRALPPFVDFPDVMKEVLEGPSFLLPGGHEFDGREITPFDIDQVQSTAKIIAEKNIQSAVVSAPFSTINDEMERLAIDILKSECPGIFVTGSAEIGAVGLLERENAAILNASLLPLAKEIVHALQEALLQAGLNRPFYLTQNDGTLMSADFARRYPVLTISSGPTNSMRGASFLGGLKDAIVVDIGGTTADIGVLVNGFPRQAARTIEIAGVRTNFRMPDVFSLGLGGGSIVSFGPDQSPIIGPISVGYRIQELAQVFGGDTLTMTDVSVSTGLADIGESKLVQLDLMMAQKVLAKADQMLEESIDRMKPNRELYPAIVVGGGSIIFHRNLQGVSEIIKPEHYEVANAIGAAIAQVGGEIDRVFSLENNSREEIIAQAKEQAILRAIEAGADPHTVDIVEIIEIPLAYLPSKAARIRIKAVGELKEEMMT